MAAIDYAGIPEYARQNLLAAAYKMTVRMFEDPEVRAEYEVWRAKRRAPATAHDSQIMEGEKHDHT